MADDAPNAGSSRSSCSEHSPLLARRTILSTTCSDPADNVMGHAGGVSVTGTGHSKPAGIDNALDEAIEFEHSLGFIEACKLYPAAIGWSVFVSLGVIMLAFDPQLLGNLYAMPQFTEDFGYLFDGNYIISAPWQTGLSMGNPAGQVFGALVAGYPMERYGRKITFGACVVLTTGLVFIQFFARSLEVLLVGELLGGLVLGCYAVIAPAYSSEVCPLAIRGILTSYVNLCFVIGQLLGNSVCAGTSKLNDHWAYSIPFALQWFWCLIILPGLIWVPESPWWLVRKGRLNEAEVVLRRLASEEVNVEQTLAVIVETDRLEQELEMGSTYWDCFRGVNLRRTEVSVGVYAIQVLSGIYLINYGTYFFQLAGLPTDEAFNMGIGFLAVGFLGTLISWPLILRFGRRTIYNSGLFVLIVLQLVIGILDCIPDRPQGVTWAESSLMLVWNFFYDISIGPVCFVIISEASATRVRSKTIAVATAVQGALGCVMTVAIPYLINPDQANLQGKLGFFFGGLAALCFVWAYFRLPETKGRTFEELDIMFERKVPTRGFRDYVIDGGAHGS
ncbi:maltose permease MAL31-like protein 8 [Echria macrotheca]|uniref:Maltose permease MAL31-like protein 8 n=1 Tax=Echria macrotheca TaxID=438768 RepID=A0AAJ0BJS7_9PEZI|nr:maltose permease MAL31-like protein 8 [Echria macrotheca]